jgi:hypothetical protein
MSGEARSLYSLGAKYANGRCMERNDTIAYALWDTINTSNDSNLTTFIQSQKYKLANRMDPYQINEAQKLSQDQENIGTILKELLSKVTKKPEKVVVEKQKTK